MLTLTTNQIEEVGIHAIARGFAAPDGSWDLKPGQEFQVSFGTVKVVGDPFSAIQVLVKMKYERDPILLASVHPTRAWINLPRWPGDYENYARRARGEDDQHYPTAKEPG